MEFINHFYRSLHGIINQVFIFLILQGILFCIFGAFVLVFPYGLVVFSAVFFITIGMFSIWVALKVETLIHRLEKIKEKISLTD